MIDRGDDIGFGLREQVGVSVDGDALGDGTDGQHDVEWGGAYAGDAYRLRFRALEAAFLHDNRVDPGIEGLHMEEAALVGDRGLADAGGHADNINFGTSDEGSRVVAHRAGNGSLPSLRGDADGGNKDSYGGAAEGPGN